MRKHSKTLAKKPNAGEMMTDIHKYLKGVLGAQSPSMIEVATYCLQYHRENWRALTLDEIIEHYEKCHDL